ncbi:HET domain-containing protein [Histoplasma ohiense]|nr:HET domain-containing protein [Histoplasma ohiense (nom. inval.)]
MRLLNVKTHKLEEFQDDSIPVYAILSHRWRADEVIFRDLETSPEFTAPRFKKLFDTCAQALMDGLGYVWVDTCCIDKSSSVELSESINSMYEWYRCAAVCYVYLNDVAESSVTEGSSFHSSVWFTRGWTLQELIAPLNVQFFNGKWQELGSKVDLKDQISAITGIPVTVLTGELAPQELSIAQRMSWACHRTTTKVEDIAYCLLGLFDINMPILYGEKEKAFIRLQEEIMKQSDDQTLFAWKISDGQTYHGLLAKSPADFAESADIVRSSSTWNKSPYSVTNLGLSVEVPMLPWAMETYFAALDVQREQKTRRLGIFLTFLPEKNQYARVSLDGEGLTEFDSNLASKCEYRRIYVRQVVSRKQKPPEKIYGFWLRHFPSRDTRPQAEFDIMSWNEWDYKERLVVIPTGQRGSAVNLRYKMKSEGSENLKLGFDSMFNPVVQFGGHRHTDKSFGTPTMHDFDVMMGTDWMDTKLEGVYKGDRLSGLDVEDTWIRILVLEETVNGKRVWVVHIEYAEEAAWHRDNFCDGCNLNIFGTRYTCRVCPDFDYCTACKEMDTAHKDHGFKTIKLLRHYGVKCDHCLETIYGVRYKCRDCDNFDLCSSCHNNANESHLNHRFAAIKKP